MVGEKISQRQAKEGRNKKKRRRMRGYWCVMLVLLMRAGFAGRLQKGPLQSISFTFPPPWLGVVRIFPRQTAQYSGFKNFRFPLYN
jgi:hypothetical protein